MHALPAGLETKGIVVRVKKGQLWALINLAVGHHLVDIGLGNTLFRVVNPRRDPLPLGIDDVNASGSLLDQDVRFGLEDPPAIID